METGDLLIYKDKGYCYNGFDNTIYGIGITESNDCIPFIEDTIEYDGTGRIACTSEIIAVQGYYVPTIVEVKEEVSVNEPIGKVETDTKPNRTSK